MWDLISTITEWFSEATERRKLVKDFNNAAQAAFISGRAPTILKAKITLGNRDYSHNFSKFLSGFTIKALSGHALSKGQMKQVAKVIIENEPLGRRLVSLGWDTLEVYSEGSKSGIQYNLSAHFGGVLTLEGW